MKIGFNSFFAKLSTRINNYKYEAKQAGLNKYCKIHDMDGALISPAQELYTAQEVIANFAKKNNIRIDIFDAKEALKNTEGNTEFVKSIGDKFNVIATNLKTGKTASRFVESNTQTVYPKTTESTMLMSDIQQGRQIVRIDRRYIEDTFLRNMYRNISDLSQTIKK